MIIKFVEIGGEFCTRRTSDAIPKIKAMIEEALLKNENVVCDWTGVKILTPSFIDEIIPELTIRHGSIKIQKYVSFNPELTGFLSHQIERGVMNRQAKG